MSSKQFSVPLMTTEVHFRRNLHVMALLQVGRGGSQKALFVVVSFYNDNYSTGIYTDLAIHCYKKQPKKHHRTDSTVSVHGNTHKDNSCSN